MQQAFFVPFPYSDFVASNIGEEWGFVGIAALTIAFAAVRTARLPHRATGAHAVSPTRRCRAHVHDGAHRVPAHRRRDRSAADDRPDAAVRLVRPIEPRAHDAVHGNPREHRQRARARDRQLGDRSARRRRPNRRAIAARMTRIVFAGGGTGGHLYPGIAIARALVRARPSIEPFFVGAQRGIERDVLPEDRIPARCCSICIRSIGRRSGTTGRRSPARFGAWRRIGALVRQERPALVVGTGGYAAGHHARVQRRAPHPDRAAGRRQLSRPHGARVQPLVARDLPELSGGGARAHGASSGSSHRHRRADRAAAVAAVRIGACARERWGLPASRRPRAARLRRQPGLAGDQSGRGRVDRARLAERPVSSSGERAARPTSSSSSSKARAFACATICRRSPRRMRRPISRSRARAR